MSRYSKILTIAVLAIQIQIGTLICTYWAEEDTDNNIFDTVNAPS